MAAIISSSNQLYDRLLSIMQRPMPATLAAGGATLLTALIIAYRDYRAYIALGPHGLPDNFQGWIKQLRMSKFARKDVTAPAPYDDADKIAKALGPNAHKSFLDRPLQPRAMSRPEIPGFVAPQRQLTQIASEDTKARMSDYLDQLAAKNPTLLKRDLSKLEGPVPALQLHDSKTIPPCLKVTRGEMVHVHPPDGSTHMVLSLADAEEVIARGWGQRHRLSGGLLQWSYTLLYAPRSDEDLEVWTRVVNAAVRFSSAEAGEVQF